MIGLKEIFIVGVTQRVDINEQTGEVRDALDRELFLWLSDAGFLPVQIPNGLINRAGALEQWIEAIKPNAILLSGGNDIGQCSSRDSTEFFLLNWSKKNNIPTLGICRGLQVMASFAGSSLQRIDGHIRMRHKLIFKSKDCDFTLNVNSYHNWAPSECPLGFLVLAMSEDGSIEAIKHQELHWEGWMWHPERESPYEINDIKRVKKLFYGY